MWERRSKGEILEDAMRAEVKDSDYYLLEVLIDIRDLLKLGLVCPPYTETSFRGKKVPGLKKDNQ